MQIRIETTVEVQDLPEAIEKLRLRGDGGSFIFISPDGERLTLSSAEWNFLLDCALLGWKFKTFDKGA